MKTLRINFCHPIKGTASLISLMPIKLASKLISFDSADSNLVVIPLDDCCVGKWRAVLTWEYENELFVHQKEFEVKG